MKYMLMMNTPRGGDYQIMSWPKKDIEAHIAFMMDFAKKLRAAGELAGAEGLSSPSQAKLVRNFSPATGSLTCPTPNVPISLRRKRPLRRVSAGRLSTWRSRSAR